MAQSPQSRSASRAILQSPTGSGDARSANSAAPLPLAIDEAELFAELLESTPPVAHQSSKNAPILPQQLEPHKPGATEASPRKAAPQLLEALLDPTAMAEVQGMLEAKQTTQTVPHETAGTTVSGSMWRNCDTRVARFVEAVIEVARGVLDAEIVECAGALLAGAELSASPRPEARAALTRAKMLDGAGDTARPSERFTAARAAFSALLRGDQADYSACGELTLDQWAAELVAGLAGQGADAAKIRCELRRRKVAAFGMLD